MKHKGKIMKKLYRYSICLVALAGSLVVPCSAMKFESVKEAIDGGHKYRLGDDYVTFNQIGLISLDGLEAIPNPELVTSIDLLGNELKDIPVGAFDRFISFDNRKTLAFKPEMNGYPLFERSFVVRQAK